MKLFEDVNKKEPNNLMKILMLLPMVLALVFVLYYSNHKSEILLWLALASLIFAGSIGIFLMGMPLGWKNLTRERYDSTWRKGR